MKLILAAIIIVNKYVGTFQWLTEHALPGLSLDSPDGVGEVGQMRHNNNSGLRGGRG